MTKTDFQPTDPARRRLLKFAVSSMTLWSMGAAWSAEPVSANPYGVRALVFDVFGTVVDWRSSLVREGQLLSQRKAYTLDWGEFADRWRAGYGPAMNRVRTGELPWTSLDRLHRMILDELVDEYGLDGLTETERDHFNRAWHRLTPWPDTVTGLNRLRNRYIIATLSNGNVSLLMNMSKNAGLVWDAVLSAELAGHYKPDPEAYLKAADLLSLRPDEVLMVAAHPSDLRAASATGMKTAYVHRPLERGPDRRITPPARDEFDLFAESFIDLAGQLGA
ncbi:MAG: haloacid dehalogenase type II [Pseudohongiellaceae bacterium]